ncbi:hypothetical protein DPMN_166001 [Dreissena polymorpha]|uniref:Uncharacterized protein n=1 Tax=Dreissena polymorpha TaxID=45954 RepID=A0A9D4EWC7_DREPO|nr:hypothetical protein DPMN_166001 [Dreissena polymorpha]
MRRHVLWRLIWIQTVCKGLQNPVPALKGLRIAYSVFKQALPEPLPWLISFLREAITSMRKSSLSPIAVPSTLAMPLND